LKRGNIEVEGGENFCQVKRLQSLGDKKNSTSWDSAGFKEKKAKE